ncbi:MAG: beta-ketoacyl-[acyl-carrier-protein] synthase family protein [Syntrophobacteraceae bacterium]|nr:beta-ketoacyl-[acyl-carrier-protein] synthase family protein [Syntrophobacteraceae bacterium]
MTDRKVVITGLGLATALGLELEQNWQKALAGVSGVSKIRLQCAGKSRVQAAAQVCENDYRSICRDFPSEAQSGGERRTLFALWAAKKALSDAGFTPCGEDRSRFGVALGAGLGVNRLEDIARWLTSGKKFDPARFASELDLVERDSIIRNNSSAPATLIASKFVLKGANFTITSACASATLALGAAYRAVKRGQADVFLAGGADSMINPVGLVFFVLLGSAAVSRMDPERLCRPFDRKRSGLVMGEGAGMAVLEEEHHALARGARIYAEVAGFASTMDAWRLTAPHPEGRGAKECMSLALADSKIAPEGIDYINAHGTSTKLNDLAETIAIKKVFENCTSYPAVSSSKSLIGHLLAGSGGPEFAFTALSVAQNRIHPTINLSSPDPKCDLDYVPDVSRQRVVRAALSNSFGFGGQNATIVVKKYFAGPGAR